MKNYFHLQGVDTTMWIIVLVVALIMAILQNDFIDWFIWGIIAAVFALLAEHAVERR